MEATIKLINEEQDLTNVKQFILKNRGIEDVNAYLNLGTQNQYSYNLFGEDNINEALEKVDYAIRNKRKIFILVDTDVDGYSSASMMYMYLRDVLKFDNLEYVLNKGKQHGLSIEIVDYLLTFAGFEKNLLIIPDAGTNDSNFCEELNTFFEIVVLDHHQKEKDNVYATIVNPQTSDYPNKSLCGAAVVYKFLQALDEFYFENGANRYLDLMAVAMIADIMDLRSLESRFLVTRGLMNVEHKFIKACIEKNSYSISNTSVPNAIDIAFYVSPMINSCIRVGTEEEHDLLFKAFIQEQGLTFKYKQRKTAKNPNPQEIDETLFAHMARICSNCKAKQDRKCDKAQEMIVEDVNAHPNWLQEKVLILNGEELDSELTGLLANKLASQFQMPTLIVKEIELQDDSLLVGSGRNYKNSFVYDFKKDIVDSGCAKMVGGHTSAFGVQIYKSKVTQLLDYFLDKYKDVTTKRSYFVDYWLEEEVPFTLIREIHEMRSLFSNFVEQPYIAVNNVCVDASEVNIETSQNGNKRFSFLFNNVEYVKFKLAENDLLLNTVDDLFGEETICFNMVGKTNVNSYGGKFTPQFIIEDYDLEVLDD